MRVELPVTVPQAPRNVTRAMRSPIDSRVGSLPPAEMPPSTERWVELLDDAFRVPLTNIRFGLDVILGLVPVVGDVAGLLCGLPLVLAGLRRRVPYSVLLVMILNILVDAVVGSIPVLGNVFDIAWRAHRKNLQLLREPSSLPLVLREARWKLGALIGIVVLLALLLLGLLLFTMKLLLLALEWGWTV
jgi:hypothetical protein